MNVGHVMVLFWFQYHISLLQVTAINYKYYAYYAFIDPNLESQQSWGFHCRAQCHPTNHLIDFLPPRANRRQGPFSAN